ncbi:MAG: hypothetical protein RBU37_25435 [Myxococcota bacterium]|jgi:hypothetical protein|nr:hypothetical protein [Myxococcota bacterium]
MKSDKQALLHQADEALQQSDQASIRELAPRLAPMTDDRALELLLSFFTIEWEGAERASKQALEAAAHPQTSARLAERLLSWAQSGEFKPGSALTEACEGGEGEKS